MTYILRKKTEQDKEYFINCGVISPFGGVPSFGYYIVDNAEENVKMALLGGQGYMEEDGTEISDMAAYCVVVWNDKKYIVEYYSHDKCVVKNKEYSIIYKLKAISSEKCNEEERKDIIQIIKDTLITYGNGGIESYVCKDVIFIDSEVRWA